MKIERCLQILELDSLDSVEQLKSAYRDLVNVWHPDRFQSNTRLNQRAEKKLREINIAYRHLLTYFESGPRNPTKMINTLDRYVQSGSGARNNTSIQIKNQVGNSLERRDDVCRIKTCQYRESNPSTVPGSSAQGRWVVFGFLAVLVVVSGLIIYFLSNTDTVVSKSNAPASDALKKIMVELEEKQSAKKNSSSFQRIIRDFGAESKEGDNKRYFEIHLNSGSIIVTDSWWHKGNMIMYRIDGGSMGIEKNRVKKIVKR